MSRKYPEPRTYIEEEFSEDEEYHNVVYVVYDEPKKNGLSSYLQPKEGLSVFNMFLQHEYPPYNINTIIKDVVEIINNTQIFSAKEINDLIIYLYISGVQTKDPVIKSKLNEKLIKRIKKTQILPFTSLCTILNAITKNYSLTQQDVDIIVSKNVREYNNSNTYNWVQNLINRNYVFTENQKAKLTSYGYTFPLHIEYENKKLTNSVLLTYLASPAKLEGIFKNKEKFVEIFKKNKLAPSTKLLMIFVNSYRAINKLANNKSIKQIINLMCDCGYVFAENDIIILFSIFANCVEGYFANIEQVDYECTSFYYGKKNGAICEESDCSAYCSSDESRPRSKREKPNEKTQHIKLNENVNYLFEFAKLKNMNMTNIIREAIFIGGYDFLDCLVHNNMIDNIDQQVVIKCAIIFKNVNIIKYFTNKKYMGTLDDILYCLYAANKYYGGCFVIDELPDPLECFLQSGSIVTPVVYESMVLLGIHEKYGHLCTSLTTAEKKLLAQQIKLPQLSNKKIYSNKYRKEKKTKVTKDVKLEEIFLETCKTKPLSQILLLIRNENIQLNSEHLNLLLTNSCPCVSLYFQYRYNVKPSLSSIINSQNFGLRYFFTKIYYPEISNQVFDMVLLNQNDKFKQVATVADKITAKPKINKVVEIAEIAEINEPDEKLVKKSKLKSEKNVKTVVKKSKNSTQPEVKKPEIDPENDELVNFE